MDECPRRNFDQLEIPAVLPAQLGAGAPQVVAPRCSMPIRFDDCSTTDQTAQSLSVSRFTFPLFETELLGEVRDALFCLGLNRG
jgi:hypothetical protein